MKYPVDTDGTIGAGTTVNIIDLAHENTDGTAMDHHGHPPGGGQLTNVAFGGTDDKTLSPPRARASSSCSCRHPECRTREGSALIRGAWLIAGVATAVEGTVRSVRRWVR
jgi:hypothetical protein